MSLNSWRHFACFPTGVELYDVLEDGFHSPLNKAQITDLFRAGRLDRNHPCKSIDKKNWRTIDELFPLLKYEPVEFPSWSSSTRKRSSSNALFYSLLGALLTLVLCGIAALFLWNDEPQPASLRIAKSSPPMSELSKPVSQYEIPLVTTHSHDPVQVRSISQAEKRAAEGRRLLQVAKEQIAAANQRREELERQQRKAEKANGTDHRVPLDQDHFVQMSGGGVWVWIHDNDVTSFDVRVNGGFRKDVPKQKGMTHSRTDETLIYSDGHSSLYYVWQISGELNHCLLRVREN